MDFCRILQKCLLVRTGVDAFAEFCESVLPIYLVREGESLPLRSQSAFLIYFLQNNIKYLVLAKNQPSPEGKSVPQNSVKAFCQYTARVSIAGFAEFCEMSVRSTVPRRGALPPPSRGLSPVTAPAPAGAGEEREARAGSGGCAPMYYVGIGWKITHLYNLGCFNSILFTHMRVNQFFSGKKFIIMGVLPSTTVKTVE